MHTITLRELVIHEAPETIIRDYCDYLGVPGIKGLDDLMALPDAAKDEPRLLVDYLNIHTADDVIWATRCLVDWREVVVKFATGCIARYAGEMDAKAHGVYIGNDAAWTMAHHARYIIGNKARDKVAAYGAERMRQTLHLRELLSKGLS
jgi:hypothetical protein